METDTLKNFFLIAMPALTDPNFEHSVIFVYEHNDDGAMGLVINKPLQITLESVLNHLEIETEDETVQFVPVLMGGPVGQEHGFVIHDEDGADDVPEDAESIVISASQDTLRQIASGHGPDNFIVTLGYAGWDAGQLEVEIARNDWLIAPFSSEIMFDTPIERRWVEAAKLIGVDINQLTNQVGHA